MKSNGDMAGDGQDTNYFSKENEIIFYKAEYKRLNKLVNCSICDQNPKEVVLPCGHLLCEKCLKKQISSRKRNCPIDRNKFSDKQPFKVYLDDAGNDDQEDADDGMNN